MGRINRSVNGFHLFGCRLEAFRAMYRTANGRNSGGPPTLVREFGIGILDAHGQGRRSGSSERARPFGPSPDFMVIEWSILNVEMAGPAFFGPPAHTNLYGNFVGRRRFIF
jgi:hypothetical protein